MSKSIYGSAIPVNVPTSGSLSGLTDVTITTPTNGQFLEYNGSKWVNASVSPGGVTSVFTRTGAVTATSGDYNISQITNASTLAVATNLNIVSPTNNQILKYNSGTTKWENGTISSTNTYYDVQYIFTTTVNPAIKNTHYILSFGGTITVAPLNPGDHLLITSQGNAITVNFTGLSFITNSYLGGGTLNPSFSLLNATLELMCVVNAGQTYYHIVRVSQNKTPSTCTLNGVKVSALQNINDIPDVNITTPTNGQVLTYNSTSSKWENAAGGGGGSVSSVFGRTGAVVSAEGDYSLTQLSDVTITTPTTGQIFGYNGTNWLNQNIYGNFKTISNLTGPISVTGIAGTMYIGGGITLNMPSGAVGDVIQLAGTGGANTIVFPTGVYLIHGAAGYQNFTMSSNFGVATLLCTVVNTWVVVGLTDYWINTAITQNFSGSIIKVADLFDATISTPSNGQVLTYNSGTSKWVNSTASAGAVSSVFGRTGAVVSAEGDYSFTQLSDVTLTTPTTGQIMRYDGSGWVNFTRYNNLYFNSGTTLTANYYIGQDSTSNTKENCKIVIGRACTLVNMYVKISANPNSTHTRTFTLIYNGAITVAFAVSFTGAQTTGSCTGSLALSQYDDICFQNTITGTPLGAQAYIALELLP